MDHHVLIIAPDDGFRSQLAILLSSRGLLVDEESDPEEAVRFLTDKGADVALFVARDAGDEDLGRIRRLHDAAPRTGIILLEHGGSVDFAMRARRGGIRDDVLIPFGLDELLEKIREAAPASRPKGRAAGRRGEADGGKHDAGWGARTKHSEDG